MTLKSDRKGFLSFFPTPEYLLLSNAGLAITDDGIRFIEFQRGLFSQNLKLSRHEKLPLSEGIVQSGFINDEASLTNSLKDLVARHRLKYVYATLPEERAYLFTAVIDKVPQEGLRDAVAFIIEANAPVSLANSVFDFDVVEELVASNQLKVVVSVISKKVADFYTQVFDAVGLVPVSFDIESQAIARAIIPKGDKTTQLVINLNNKKTGFYVVEDEVVQFTTTLPYGSSVRQDSSHMNDLKNEMSKVFGFWDTRNNVSNIDNRKIERILLCGSGAKNESFVSELTKDCSVRIDTADVWVNAGEEARDFPEELDKEALEYASAIGLALPHPDINHV